MPKNFKSFCILLSSLLLINGCTVKRAVVESKEVNISHNDLYEKINTFSNNQALIFIKGSKISIDDNSGLTNFKANFLVKKDSAVLVSLTSLMGIEVSRALILKDSIKVIDRINKSYYEEAYEEIEKRFSIALDFQQLQNVLTGDFKTEINNRINKEDIINGSEIGDLKIITKNRKNQDDIIETILHINTIYFYVNQATMLFDKEKQEYDILYSDYLSLENYFYPGFIEIEFKKEKTKLKIAIQNRSVKFQPNQVISISIPANYERIKSRKHGN